MVLIKFDLTEKPRETRRLWEKNGDQLYHWQRMLSSIFGKDYTSYTE